MVVYYVFGFVASAITIISDSINIVMAHYCKIISIMTTIAIMMIISFIIALFCSLSIPNCIVSLPKDQISIVSKVKMN